MAKPHKYIFGRLNINAVFDDKQIFVMNALNKGNTINYKDYKWGFYKVESIDIAELTFVTGFLVKYNAIDTVESVNEEDHLIIDTEIENTIKAKCRFFLHIKSGLLIYHPLSDIDAGGFKNRFVDLFIDAYDNFFVEATIYSVEENFNFIQQLKDLSIVKKIKITLHPSNPSNRDLWQDVDDRLKKINVDTYTEIYSTKEGSMDIDTNIESKLHMVNDGYGTANAKGVLNGIEIELNTEDNPVYADVPNDLTEPDSILAALRDKIIEFFSRFR